MYPWTCPLGYILFKSSFYSFLGRYIKCLCVESREEYTSRAVLPTLPLFKGEGPPHPFRWTLFLSPTTILFSTPFDVTTVPIFIFIPCLFVGLFVCLFSVLLPACSLNVSFTFVLGNGSVLHISCNLSFLPNSMFLKVHPCFCMSLTSIHFCFWIAFPFRDAATKRIYSLTEGQWMMSGFEITESP